MALKNTDTNSEYPYAFMISQHVTQRVMENADDPPDYTVHVIYRFYKIENNKVVFDPNSQLTVDIDNLVTLAVNDATNGDLTHNNTLVAQELSVKRFLETETGATYEVV